MHACGANLHSGTTKQQKQQQHACMHACGTNLHSWHNKTITAAACMHACLWHKSAFWHSKNSAAAATTCMHACLWHKSASMAQQNNNSSNNIHAWHNWCCDIRGGATPSILHVWAIDCIHCQDMCSCRCASCIQQAL